MRKTTTITVKEKFIKAGLKVRQLETVEDLKSNSNWIMSTHDRNGMIKLETNKKRTVVIAK